MHPSFFARKVHIAHLTQDIVEWIGEVGEITKKPFPPRFSFWGVSDLVESLEVVPVVDSISLGCRERKIQRPYLARCQF